MRINGIECKDNDYLIVRNVRYEDFVQVIHCNTLRHKSIPKSEFCKGGSYHFLNEGREGISYHDFVGRNLVIIESLRGEVGDYIIDAKLDRGSQVSTVNLWFKGVAYKVINSYKPIMLEIDWAGNLIIRYTYYGEQGMWYETSKYGLYRVTLKDLKIMMPVFGIPKSKSQFKRGLLF